MRSIAPLNPHALLVQQWFLGILVWSCSGSCNVKGNSNGLHGEVSNDSNSIFQTNVC